MTMTFDSLVSQVMLIFERNDEPFSRLIPNFIEQAHQRIVREAVSLEMVYYVKSNLVIGNNVLDKPDNWCRPLALKIIIPGEINQYQIVEWRSYDFCKAFFPCDYNIPSQLTTPPVFSDIPLFYGDYGREHLILSPVPAVDYPFELAYYGLVLAVNSDLQTNFLTRYAPNLLLYATLLEACTFLKNDERMQVWELTYRQALQEFNNSDKEAKEDRQTKRGKD